MRYTTLVEQRPCRLRPSSSTSNERLERRPQSDSFPYRPAMCQRQSLTGRRRDATSVLSPGPLSKKASPSSSLGSKSMNASSGRLRNRSSKPACPPAHKRRVVVIGGGTGTFTVLSGLRAYGDLDLSAIVTMADDGGSTGRLPDADGVLPPRDL